MLQKSLDIIENKFFEYLNSLGLSSASYKNYKSDFNNFCGWFILKIKSIGSLVETFSEMVPFLSSTVACDYKTYMNINNVPVKTVNRRLSTLRHLSRFLVSEQIIESDFMIGQTNIFKDQNTSFEAISNFAKFLEKEEVSESTSKNYLSDIRQLFQTLN